MQNDDFERQRILIEGENVNVSEKNLLKDFSQIIINLILTLVCLYFSVFFISGLIIKNLSIEKQIILENIISGAVEEKNIQNIKDEEIKKINNIKSKILYYDKEFPKTSKLQVKIVKKNKPNALCLPNGNIYITSDLYEKVKNNDEMMFFILSHEMAHYKNKDHIMNLRKSIAQSSVLVLVSILGYNQKDLSTLVDGTMDLSDLNYSRSVEARADKYAGKMLLKEFGNINGAIETLKLLSNKEYPEIFGVFSTHPTIKKRIKNLKKLEKTYKN